MSNVKDLGEEQNGIYPPSELLSYSGYHWLHAERSSTASIAQWYNGRWYLISEAPISPQELAKRGWEYLGPCQDRPHSKYIDG